MIQHDGSSCGVSHNGECILSGPGHYNDYDMLLGGNPGLSLDEAKIQVCHECTIARPIIVLLGLLHASLGCVHTWVMDDAKRDILQ